MTDLLLTTALEARDRGLTLLWETFPDNVGRRVAGFSILNTMVGRHASSMEVTILRKMVSIELDTWAYGDDITDALDALIAAGILRKDRPNSLDHVQFNFSSP